MSAEQQGIRDSGDSGAPCRFRSGTCKSEAANPRQRAVLSMPCKLLVVIEPMNMQRQSNATRDRRFGKACCLSASWLPLEHACLLSTKPGRTSDIMALHGKAQSRGVQFVRKPAVSHPHKAQDTTCWLTLRQTNFRKMRLMSSDPINDLGLSAGGLPHCWSEHTGAMHKETQYHLARLSLPDTAPIVGSLL